MGGNVCPIACWCFFLGLKFDFRLPLEVTRLKHGLPEAGFSLPVCCILISWSAIEMSMLIIAPKQVGPHAKLKCLGNFHAF